MDFYKKLISHKAINNLSWKDIGDIINKEATTTRIAVKRESLSDLEIRELENNFELEKNNQKEKPKNDVVNEDSVDYVKTPTNSNKSLSDKEARELAYKVALHEERLMQEKIFANIINIRVSKEIARITSTRDELKKYLRE